MGEVEYIGKPKGKFLEFILLLLLRYFVVNFVNFE
jgi:hypothetical protein